MKLDLDYINQILVAVKEHPNPQMQQTALMQALNVTADNQQDFGKFYYHMKRIEEAGFMTSTHKPTSPNDGFGFVWQYGGRKPCDTEYELTLEGQWFVHTSRQKGTDAARQDILYRDFAV